MIVCPECGGATKVLHTKESVKGTRRRRQCLTCKVRITTLEVREDLFEFMREIEKLFDKRKTILESTKRKARPHRSKAELAAKRRGGWHVPDDKIGDWNTLIKQGDYSFDEAATSLKLDKFIDVKPILASQK